ncbi:MAG: phosphoribosyltransferase [Alphaproteobacteria bacterium]|jgi:hypoxanthine phosphoribosyltransferase|nr:phosphoribosyltransferase [Alphaproteobacteria bacterium]
MADRGPPPAPLLTAAEIADRVEALAVRLAPRLDPDALAVTLLMGGLWFAADLTRALSRLGVALENDGLWLTSYGEGRTSQGHCDIRALPRGKVRGRQVLLIDDVAETGLSLAEARRLMIAAGAREVLTAVFARKPHLAPAIVPDEFAFAAPDRFLVGYGMDLAGCFRDLSYLGALD